MSDTATDDLVPEPQAAAQADPPPEPQAQGDGDPSPLNIEDDAAVDAALDQATIEIPGDEGVVAKSEAGRIAHAYRKQLKDVKAQLAAATEGSAKAAQLEQRLQQLETQLQQQAPYLQAYQAMTQAAQQTAAPNPQEDAEAEEYAKLLDLYTPDGKPDLERGKKGLALQRKLAEAAAQKHVAPIQQQTASQQSTYNLARAKNTTLPNGTKADPGVLDMVWQRLDPAITATAEGAQQALIAAVGYTMLLGQQPAQATQPTQQTTPQRAPNGQFQAQQVPPPMFTERAGGKDVSAADSELSEADKKYIKSAGITEKEFLESARKASWLRK